MADPLKHSPKVCYTIFELPVDVELLLHLKLTAKLVDD